MRGANAIDFWRGFALVSIFVNHVPGNWFERVTPRNYGFSDSAELFVFLAGWSLRHVVASAARQDGGRASTGRLVLRLGGRAFTLYAAQMLITMLAIAMIATFALFLDDPALLDWHNAGAVFRDPVQAHVGLVLLTHQLGFFDILPLYVVLLALAPGVALVDRLAPRWLLPASFALYLAAQVFRLNLHTWPVEGEWYFNPLAWQFVYVLGFVAARLQADGALMGRRQPWIRWSAILFVVATAIIARLGYFPDPTRVPQPTTLFIVEKSYVTPLRIIHLLALTIAFTGVFDGIARRASGFAVTLAGLGRNSLQVFCVGSLLSLSGQLVRVVVPPSLAVDAIVVIIGIAILYFTAWIVEWRERTKPS